MKITKQLFRFTLLLTAMFLVATNSKAQCPWVLKSEINCVPVIKLQMICGNDTSSYLIRDTAKGKWDTAFVQTTVLVDSSKAICDTLNCDSCTFKLLINGIPYGQNAIFCCSPAPSCAIRSNCGQIDINCRKRVIRIKKPSFCP